MRASPIKNLFPANTVMNSNLASIPVGLYQIFGYTIQLVFTGTPTGSFSLQASADPYYNNPSSSQAPTNWTTIANSTFSVNAAGNVMWNVADVGYNWVQVVYTDTSGGLSSAVITVAEMNIKGV